MDNIDYQEAIMSYFTENVIQAIKVQDNLQQDLAQKQEVYENIRSRIIDLYITGTEKLKEKNVENPINHEGKSRFEIGQDVIKAFINSKPEYNNFVNAMKEIPELREAGNLETEMAKALLDFYKAFKKFNDQIINDRNVIFSKDYQDKIDEYAKTGWFFFYLASPDIPLLHDFCDEQYICETFVYLNCSNIRILLSGFLGQNNPSDSMRRKIQDLNDAINLISHQGYRSAARNIFALLESESKNCSNALRNLEFKTQNLRTGIERAKEIENIVNSINVNWYKDTFQKINSYYKKATSNDITPGIVNRNALIHGDYYKDYMDVSLSDTLKLLLMFVNYRVISDFVQYVVELEADTMQYAMVGLAAMLRK
ncbi:MAG: hypothetical protein K9L02_02965 [Acholeplasmataceae bacterium]|nr:hypothetical protein [Acholeplasmataceae bacterium]